MWFFGVYNASIFFTIYCVVFVLSLQVFNVKYFFFPSVGFWSYLCWVFCYPGGFVICVGFVICGVGFCFTFVGFVICVGFVLPV